MVSADAGFRSAALWQAVSQLPLTEEAELRLAGEPPSLVVRPRPEADPAGPYLPQSVQKTCEMCHGPKEPHTKCPTPGCRQRKKELKRANPVEYSARRAAVGKSAQFP